MNIQEHISDIRRRIRGLKANRPVTISQINLLQVSTAINLTLGVGAEAQIRATIECAGAPIADVAIQNGINPGISPYSTTWTISGNTTTAIIYVSNSGTASATRTLTFTAFALNGISAVIERIS